LPETVDVLEVELDDDVVDVVVVLDVVVVVENRCRRLGEVV